MSTVYVVRKAYFCAAHRLNNPDKDQAWNDEQYELCNSIHGHNYKLEVTVAGKIDPDTGFVISAKLLKELIHKKIINKCDHRNFNTDVDFLEGINPSMENLVIAMWKELEDELPKNCWLYNVRLIETDKNFVDYRGE